ncbi:uncharacterized protein LOC121577560 [Coregonus clupeaformis]|uniref:uncharacterized protein LOC121577560 n=1 Tax=Coregonus clupeaformis TaxID=59861 RepID=UPI001BDF8FD2|nr:uncharacterized protein LOC121577560 [Coregonus clupeaformis]
MRRIRGIYRCQITNNHYRDVGLKAKECTLSGTSQIDFTIYSGQSVLLPCSCTDPKTKPNSFTWHLYKKKNSGSWVTLTQSAEVEIFNTENSPGNLSVLLSHFTKSDVRQYRCGINNGQYRTFNLIVKESEQPKTLTTTKRPTVPPLKTPTTKTSLPTASKGGKGRNSGETPSTSLDPNNFILAVLPVMLIIAGVALYIYRRNKGGSISDILHHRPHERKGESSCESGE